MSRMPRLLAVSVMLLALAPAREARASSWESPEFAAAIGRPKRIALLPAQSSMVRTRVNDALPFVKETRALEEALRSAAEAELKAAGYEPDVDSLSPEKLAADRELQALVRALETQVGGIVDVASGKPRDIGRGRFSVGEAVLPLAQATGADGFLWMQSQSVVPSKGQRTLGSIFSVMAGTYAVPSNRTQLVAFLIDASTGDLASVTVAQTGGAVLKEPVKVAQNVTKELFRQWPAHATARRVSDKRLAAEQAATKPVVPLEGQAVEELEIIARFETAVASLERDASLGLTEHIETRDEFTQAGQPVAADGALPAEPVSLFESPGSTAAAASPPLAAAVQPAAAAGPDGRTPKIMWSAPAQPPSRQVVLQMLAGTPGVDVRNGTRERLVVSVDLSDWVELAAGQEHAFDVGPGSHRILVATPGGAELARASVLVSSSRAKAEVL